MKAETADKKSDWSKTQYANLIRYIPSGKYYARIRASGKLIVKSLKTISISVAKLRLSDMEKSERQNAEHQNEAVDGKGDPVTAAKNGEFRLLPMIPEMKNLLQVLRRRRADEKPDTTVMRVRECQKAMDRVAKKLGMVPLKSLFVLIRADEVELKHSNFATPSCALC
jgi:hypothetical protein